MQVYQKHAGDGAKLLIKRFRHWPNCQSDTEAIIVAKIQSL